MATLQNSSPKACAIEDSTAPCYATSFGFLCAYTVRTKDKHTEETFDGHWKFACFMIESDQDITKDYLSSLTALFPSTVFLFVCVGQSRPVSDSSKELLASFANIVLINNDCMLFDKIETKFGSATTLRQVMRQVLFEYDLQDDEITAERKATVAIADGVTNLLKAKRLGEARKKQYLQAITAFHEYFRENSLDKPLSNIETMRKTYLSKREPARSTRKLLETATFTEIYRELLKGANARSTLLPGTAAPPSRSKQAVA